MYDKDTWKYGEGVPTKGTSKEKEYVGEPEGFRTDFSDTMEPYRGARTYPSVEIFRGR